MYYYYYTADETSECSPFMCMMECQFGFKRDAQGCEVCQCEEELCQVSEHVCLRYLDEILNIYNIAYIMHAVYYQD